jgi:rhamnosyltransferase
MDPALEHLEAAALVLNFNRGGVAGGFNRGVEEALLHGAEWITLLDQDSRIGAEGLAGLVGLLRSAPASRIVVGPTVWDERRQVRHGRVWSDDAIESPTRLLISSGTTFRASEWISLGTFNEDLCIDFVDHAWCFRAQSRGFRLVQHSRILLSQEFGKRHPSQFCHALGMQLYTPTRHFFSIRNLRWLSLQPYVPLDLKLKELIKMAFKPWIWILFEPRRRENLAAILRGLVAPLPSSH